MMKKLIVTALAIFLICSFAACSPQSISVLEALDGVGEVRLTWQENTVDKTDAAWIDGLREKINAAELTPLDSVDDVPQVEDYVEVEFVLEEDTLSAYLYSEEDIWYLEVPYQGIYVVDESVVDYIREALTAEQGIPEAPPGTGL